MAPAGKRPLALSPSRWPVRWRIAGVSAGLTFAILLVFAAGVGRLVENRLRADFRDELEAKASELALTVGPRWIRSAVSPRSMRAPLDKIAQGADGSDPHRRRGGQRAMVTDERPLPSPAARNQSLLASCEVATSQVQPLASERPDPSYVQFARDHDELDATIDRLWLFLGVGVGGGALLATLAGLWIAQRAMRPIAGLTATAREIATTRDPSLSMPAAECRGRGGRARPDARLDAPRARRGTDRVPADGPGTARVHRRCFARAANAAHKHPREPRAAPGAPRGRRRRRERDGRLRAALLAADAPARRRPPDARPRGCRSSRRADAVRSG